jgi:hypothetical protein
MISSFDRHPTPDAGNREREAGIIGPEGNSMIHILSMGHLDPAAVGRRQAIVLRPLEMGILNRLLGEVGGTDKQGRPPLDGVPVEIKDGTVACRWLIGGYCNRITEEFALPLQKETGCVLADREHSRVIEPDQLQGVNRPATTAREDRGR